MNEIVSFPVYLSLNFHHDESEMLYKTVLSFELVISLILYLIYSVVEQFKDNNIPNRVYKYNANKCLTLHK